MELHLCSSYAFFVWTGTFFVYKHVQDTNGVNTNSLRPIRKISFVFCKFWFMQGLWQCTVLMLCSGSFFEWYWIKKSESLSRLINVIAWMRRLFEKLIATVLLKKYHAFVQLGGSFLCRGVHHFTLSWARWIQSTLDTLFSISSLLFPLSCSVLIAMSYL
jgi:hypothetical protein